MIQTNLLQGTSGKTAASFVTLDLCVCRLESAEGPARVGHSVEDLLTQLATQIAWHPGAINPATFMPCWRVFKFPFAFSRKKKACLQVQAGVEWLPISDR
jgi:hypothetical protein